METKKTIEKAMEILKGHDWWWMFADYTHPAYDDAYDNMRAFVETVATIADEVIRKALRELWIAKHEYISATMFKSNEQEKAKYESKKAELMAIIQPQLATAA